MEQVLIIEPATELHFTGPFTNYVTAYLKLTNPIHQPVSFKIKTTVPKKYCTRPNSGILKPKQETTVEVTLLPFVYNPNKKYNHKFMVQTMIVPEGDVNVDVLWQEAKPKSVMSTKLICVLHNMPDLNVRIMASKSSEVEVVPSLSSNLRNPENFDLPPEGEKENEFTVSSVNNIGGYITRKRSEVHMEWTFVLSLTIMPFDSPSFELSGYVCCFRVQYILTIPTLYLVVKDKLNINFGRINITFGVESNGIQYNKGTQQFILEKFSRTLLAKVDKSDTFKTMTAMFSMKQQASETISVMFSLRDEVPKTMTSMFSTKEEVPNSGKENPLIIELETLSTNFEDLFKNKRKCDVTIKVKNVEFQAHKFLLMARSSVFAATFEHDMSESETGVINIVDCDPDSFEHFLQYLYTGKLKKVSFINAYHLYMTADKYDVKELKSSCLSYMLQNLTVENVCDVITLADQYEEKQLMSAAQKYFSENFSKIVSATQWETLLKTNHRLVNKLLKKIISKDEISMIN